MKVKTVIQCDVSIRRNLCLKLQKVDKGRQIETVTSAFPCCPNLKNYLRPIKTSHKNCFPYHNLFSISCQWRSAIQLDLDRV